jgi:hypothetical protein
MAVRNDINQGSSSGHFSIEHRPSPARRWPRRTFVVLSVLLLVLLIFAAVRFAAGVSATNDQLFVRVGNQQVMTLDLRQSLPISPALLGVNVFPKIGTFSQDNAAGFMQYSPSLIEGFRDARIKLLRFPGSAWGEKHYLTLDQLGAYNTLLQEVNSDGMIQVRLSGPIGGNFPELADIKNRAHIASQWVDFFNNPHSNQRVGNFAHVPFHPVKLWTVGNESDTLINPATGQRYTVREYVQDFIQFSVAMHRTDPTIKVFGPEISEFYGPGAGPSDANGELWMEGFLKGVGAYERANHVTVLDGVSFHRSLFANAQAPYAFLSGTGEWNYLIPGLHQLIAQNLERDVPIAVTTINTNPPHQLAPSRGLAALWWADTLGTLMNQQVSYVAFSSVAGAGTPYSLFSAGQQPTPMFRVMELFSRLQRNLVPLEAQRDPVSVYATQDDSHSTASLLFINKSPTTQLAQISAQNSLFMISPWTSLDVSLKGYSMVVVTLHRNGSGSDEAYSFTAPANNDASTGLVVHAICGNKTDALPNALPC